VVRELSKPLINEEIFFGFDDLSEEYDYGREIFKEDVYEFHPDLVIPYKKHQLCYIPGLFEHKCEDMGYIFYNIRGYLRRGKVTDNIIKLGVKMTILDDEQKIQEETDVETQILLKKPKKLNSLINNEDMYDIEIDHELKKIDIFDKDFFQYLSNCYFNKSVRRGKPKDEFAIPFDKIKVRVYIYRCLNLSAQDDAADYFVKMAGMSALSKANSYLEIIVGEDITSSNTKQIKYINDRNNFIPNTLNPDFFKYFELEAELPQDWKLTINVMSKNNTGSDSLIGSTIIDLEDRYLGEYRTRELLKLKSLEKKYFQELEKIEEENENNLKEHKFLIADIKARLNSIHKKMDEIKESQIPVEYRPLLHPYKKTAQGIVEMFVEVLPVARAKQIKPSKIEPPMPENYELRLVIWETKNVYLEGKKSIDVFIKVNYNPEGWLGEVIILLI